VRLSLLLVCSLALSAAPARAAEQAADPAIAGSVDGAAEASSESTGVDEVGTAATEAGDAEASSAAADPDAPDDPSLASEMDEVARELEEMRAAEAAAVDSDSARAEQLYRLLFQTGPASPLHQRLEDALELGRALPLIAATAQADGEALAQIADFDIERARRLYDIPVDMHPLVVEYIRFFQTSGRKHFVRWLGRSSKYLPMMRKTLKEAGLPEDTVYLSMIESGFSPMAYSWAKAAGLWQFIEPTGKRFGLKVDFWVDERRDPVRATRAATEYLKELYAEFGDWRLAWAGYNAGAGRVRRAIRTEGTRNFWDMVEGPTLRKETKHYVPKLMAAALISKHLKLFGFSEEEILAQAPLEFDLAEVPEATDLEVIARAANTSLQTIKELNPELRRWCTPPARSKDDVYMVKLPRGSSELFAEGFAKIAPKDRLTFRVHKVVRGDTLSQIALRYGSAVEAIMRMNGLRDSRRLRLGTQLVVPVPRSGGSERLAVQARRRGFTAAPASQEIPAAPVRRGGAPAGTARTVKEGGRTKVIYAVAPGDSLWSIARHYDVTVEKLRTWNALRSRRATLRVGPEIVIYPPEQTAPARPQGVAARTPPTPGAAAARPPPPGGRRSAVHVVAPGDTLWSLSQRYGVSVAELKRWNGIRKASALQVGQSLKIAAPDT
jgi:membrane-bound lytic murein transglycosylase D